MGWRTWKGIGEHRNRIEMGRKKREVKGRNCGEGVGGPRGQGRGAQDPPTHGWASVVGLDPKGWVGEHGRGLRSIEMG